MNRLLVLLAAVLFGTTGTAQALGAPGASPVTVGEARIVIGALGLQWAARCLAPRPGELTGARWTPALPRSAAQWLAAAGVAGYQVTFFLAVRAGVAVGTVVALGSAPAVTGALAWAFGHGRPGRRWAAATSLAVAGLAILALGRGTPAQADLGGILLALAAAACYAIYTLTVKQSLEQGEAPERVMAAVFTGGAVLLGPALVLLPVSWLATPKGALAALWLGLVPTAAAYVLFARGLRGLSAAEASTLTLAEPLTATALGVLVLGEQPAASTAAGAALLLSGLLVLGVRRPRRPGPARRRIPARTAQ